MFTRLLLASSVALSVVAPANAQYENGTYFYRYKTAIGDDGPTSAAKDITAFYIGGIGLDFSEGLPMKAEWEDDDWSIVKGTLPPGLSFDTRTRTFSGVPTKAGVKTVVKLEGVDADGKRVGTASASFDVYQLPDKVVNIDFYAHTNKFAVNAMPIPSGVTVREPLDILSTMPPGVVVNGRNFDGTPTKAGVYPILVIGSDFLGKPILAFKGRYIVEDGPTFDKIVDDIRDLPTVIPRQYFGFGAPNALAVRHSINTPSKVRYFLETAAGESLPGNVASKGANGIVSVYGWVDDPYRTAKVRLRAVDSDATTGFSNWFTFGTANPSPECNPFSPVEIKVSTGTPASISVPWPQGAVGTVSFHLTDGVLPDGIKLDSETGKFVGTPSKAETARVVDIRIDVANGSNTVSKACKFNISSINGNLRLVDATPPQGQHIRVGGNYAGTVSIQGGIPDYNLAFSSSQPTLSFTTPTKNSQTVGVSGTMNVKGFPNSIALTVANGDGNTVAGTLPIYAYGPIAKPTVADFSAKRLAKSAVWGTAVPDLETVIPDVTSFTKQPVMSISPALPAGLAFDGTSYEVTGVPTAPVGHYGPFTITMSDFSGDTVTSEPFGVEITERDQLAASAPTAPQFPITKVNKEKPVTVSPPSGVPALPIEDYRLDGPPLPGSISFDTKTGELTADRPEFEAVGSYPNYTVTATDAEGWSVTSDPFEIKITDIPSPAVGTVARSTKGNVTSSAQPVWVQTPTLNDRVDLNTIVGDKTGISFSFDDQYHPAGLFIDPETGIISGNPTETFDGDVVVRITDAKGRKGVTNVPLTILPFPDLSAPSSFDLPRLSTASNIGVTPNAGFWGSPSYQLATPSALPNGLSVDPATGKITGSTDAAEQTFTGITISATDRGGSNITVTSAPFALVIKPRAAMTISYAGTVKFLFNDSPSKAYTFDHADTQAFPAIVAGSKLDPMHYELKSSVPVGDAATLSGVGINQATGRFTGNPPALGKWTATVSGTDADGYTATTETTLWATLGGSVMPVKGGDGKTVRSGETFHTTDATVTNAVGDVTYSTIPAALPSGLNFSGATGAFNGHVDGEGLQSILVNGTDEDGRSMASPYNYSFKIVPPLSLRAVPQAFVNATQYDPANAINLTLPAVQFLMGNLRYGISGTVPGTLVHKVYDNAGNFQSYLYRASDAATVDTVTTDENSLPLDALQLDEKLGTLRGIPSKSGSFVIRGTATDDHADAYENPADPTRIGNNSAVTESITLNVRVADPLTLVASSNPKGIVVPDGNGNVTITAKNLPYGIAIADKDWSISGASGLPSGVTYAVKDGAFLFSGTSTAFGTYQNIVVTAKDALGRAGSENMTFKVFLSTDPIILNVADITTKVGVPIKMEPPFASAALSTGNTFGTIVFKSPDIGSHPGLTFDKTTGAVVGTLNTIQSFVLNVSATDDTNRITSKGVNVTIIPNLRLIVATFIPAPQGEAIDTPTATDYAIGKVKYAKGNPSAWPDGVVVDENTGKLSGEVTAQVGKYTGLTVVGTDASGDTQSSNPFTIDVSPLQASPVIADIAGNRLVYGTVGTAAQPFVPTVKDSVKSKPWNYGGTVYSINKTLPAGLSFDTKTGVISGQPLAAAIIRDLVITVTSQAGESDSTAPFWFGVQPAGAITPSGGQTLVYNARVGMTLATNAPLFDNTVGILAYSMVESPGPGAMSSTTGVYTAPAYHQADIGNWPLTVKVLDEFGRVGTLSLRLIVTPELSVSIPSVKTRILINTAYSSMNVPTTSGATSPRYSVSGLPAGLSIDAVTGGISGSVSDIGTYNVVLTVTDTADGGTATASYTMTVAAAGTPHRYWRAIWQPTYSYYVNFGGIDLFAADGTNLSLMALNGPATASITTRFVALDMYGCIDGNIGTECYPVVDGNGDISVSFDFKNPVYVDSAKWTARTDGFAGTAYKMRIESSDDNARWFTEMSGTTATNKLSETITR